jgi:hypothetical protein
MKSNVERMRIFVFKIWFLTLFVILATFALTMSGLSGHLSPPFSSVFQSLQMLIGLVVPQIGAMSAFYLNIEAQQEKIRSLTLEQITVITALSISYHFIFVICTIAGIGFYVFDQISDGNSLVRNTAAVVSIMGLFSVFLLPVAFLFAKPANADATQSQRASEKQDY